MGRCQEEGGGQQSVSNLCNLNSTCRKDFYSDSNCRKNFTQIQLAEKLMETTLIWTSSKGQQTKAKGWKDGSHYSYPWHHNSMKNCPRPIQNHKTPEGQKLTKTKRRFAAVQWQNRRVLPRPEWLRLTWKGMKRFEKFALWGEERGPSPWGGARVSTVIVASCCLGVGEIVKWNWLLQPPFVLPLAPPRGLE